MDVRTIRPRDSAVEATLTAPPSKSVTHRALVAASLAQGSSVIRNALVSDDTGATCGGLRALGIEIERRQGDLHIQGVGGVVKGGGRLQLGESGTSLRLLSALACMGREVSQIDGGERLRRRPIEELAEALRLLGGNIESDSWPLRAGGSTLAGGGVSLSGTRSSQFASALMMIAPCLEEGLRLRLLPPVVSAPYIDLTARVMTDFGACLEHDEQDSWRVHPCGMQGREYTVEGDHSSASYFLAAAAVCGGCVRVRGIDPASAQPDARLGRQLAELGCTHETGVDWVQIRGTGVIPGFSIDLAEAPDLAPTLAALAVFANGACRLGGLSHLRFKESDRLKLLTENLCRLGRSARVVEDAILIDGDASGVRGAEIETASDHRMAMAFALVGLRLEGLRIPDPDSVGKSNPAFWERWAMLEGGR